MVGGGRGFIKALRCWVKSMVLKSAAIALADPTLHIWATQCCISFAYWIFFCLSYNSFYWKINSFNRNQTDLLTHSHKQDSFCKFCNILLSTTHIFILSAPLAHHMYSGWRIYKWWNLGLLYVCRCVPSSYYIYSGWRIHKWWNVGSLYVCRCLPSTHWQRLEKKWKVR